VDGEKLAHAPLDCAQRRALEKPKESKKMTLLDELTEFLMTIRPDLPIWEAQEFAEQYILEIYTGRAF